MQRFEKASKNWDSKTHLLLNSRACIDDLKKYAKLSNFKQILDYGCGTGFLAFELKSKTNHILGLDATGGMVERFNQKAKDGEFENIEARVHDINKQELPRCSFDLFISSMTMHHIKDTKMFAKKAYDSLKADGFVCINDLVKEDGSFHSDNSGVEHFGYDVCELKGIFESVGFRVLSCEQTYSFSKNDISYPVFNLVAQKSLNHFAIFGNPIEHSKSPTMHNLAFLHDGYNGKYKKHLLTDGEMVAKEFLSNAYKGANITVPFKEYAFRLAYEVRGVAKKIGAVNTYVLEGERIIAYNTDAGGFLKAIEKFGEINSVLLLGGGGTARAIAVALQEEGIEVEVLNRSKARLEFFKNIGVKCSSWDEFEPRKYELVVNSTSAGLKDDNLPYEKKELEAILAKAKFAFDCIYGKMTPFLALAKELGCEVKDGKDMLLFQGILAYEFFTGFKARSELKDIMSKALD